jgi:hypothetical protein
VVENIVKIFKLEKHSNLQMPVDRDWALLAARYWCWHYLHHPVHRSLQAVFLRNIVLFRHASQPSQFRKASWPLPLSEMVTVLLFLYSTAVFLRQILLKIIYA